MKVVGIILGFVLVSVVSIAQVLDPTTESPLDGVYSKSVDTPHKKPVSYVELREADIMWLKRVWREIDIREKANHSFYFPLSPTQGRKNFITIIVEALEMERLHAYAAQDSESFDPEDTFKTPVTFDQAMGTFKEEVTITVQDEFGDDVTELVSQEIEWSKEITRFRLKEEVFFDKQRSVMETRILGIAPMIPIKEDGEITGYTEAFWIYFPEARYVFAEAEVYNTHNDVDRMTYEELFWKRKFNSRIVKMSNVYDRTIDQYKTPMDALLEAEYMEEQIFNKEHDLWSF